MIGRIFDFMGYRLRRWVQSRVIRRLASITTSHALRDIFRGLSIRPEDVFADLPGPQNAAGRIRLAQQKALRFGRFTPPTLLYQRN